MKMTPAQETAAWIERQKAGEDEELRSWGCKNPDRARLAEEWEYYYSMQGQADRAKRSGGPQE